MSEDCNHGHNSASEESYFDKETLRLIASLRYRLSNPILPLSEPSARALLARSGLSEAA
jgi:hypothetical protein